jgi:hypothetical protein
MYLLLLKYLYGLPQAAAHFANHLSKSMTNMKFRKVKVDSCLYVRIGKNKVDRVSAGTHVDDILISATDEDIDVFDIDIKRIYKVTSNRKGNLSYISLYIMSDRDRNYLVSQKGYRIDILSNYKSDIEKVKEIVKTPARANVIEDDEGEVLYDDIKHYLSIIMSIMYIARLTRYEMLFAVSYLATKAKKPTIKNYKADCRLLRYLECSGDVAILFRRNCRFGIRIGCDLSHRMYKDGKGQGGIMVSIGSGVVHARSYKIKVTVLSPSESEGVTVCEAGTYAIFMICLCRALGHNWNEEDFVTIKQDNLSTIWLQSHDGVFGRNKHILARDNYVKELIKEGIVKVSHCDTEFLNADMETKVVELIQQNRLMQKSDMVYIDGRIENNGESNKRIVKASKMKT